MVLREILFGEILFSDEKRIALKSEYVESGINRWASIHTLRHLFDMHLLEKGTDLRYFQELLGDQSSKTTEICNHVTKSAFGKLKNPLDRLIIEGEE
ncbi:MAG: tyrosine-type recombinase/integrase [Candidatus Delongbacteria bacterium]|nr:tyrosine-type recombinase/integrase [Candidatus Delongbacteria bacterium]MBN2836403.1 tyrosine-type recombinase/integrase [Candidatus Delongbacteria bacterium]